MAFYMSSTERYLRMQVEIEKLAKKNKVKLHLHITTGSTS